MAKRMSYAASRTRIVHRALGMLEPVKVLILSRINAEIDVLLSRASENGRVVSIRHWNGVTEDCRALSFAPKTGRSNCAG